MVLRYVGRWYPSAKGQFVIPIVVFGECRERGMVRGLIEIRFPRHEHMDCANVNVNVRGHAGSKKTPTPDCAPPQQHVDLINTLTSTPYKSATTQSILDSFARIFFCMSKNGISNISTPKKARIRGAADFNDAMGIPYYHTDLFKFYGVSKHQGWAILKEGIEEEVSEDLPGMSFDRTHHNNPAIEERRGRKPLLTPAQVYEADRFLQDVGWDARVLTWAQLAKELDFGVSGDTMKRALGSLDYHKCVACTKGWVSQRCAKQRVQFAETHLALKPDANDWHNVRFSDEVHCRVGPQGKLRLIRRPGERYCSDCIQEQLNRDDEREWETSHIWAAVGYNFKSDLTFYNTPGNRNGKLSLTVYRDQILEPVVGSWLQDPNQSHFILEEDNDSGHGGGSSSNIVATWKRRNALDHYFNCPNSPDLAPIENCWQVMKQHLKKHPHWNESEVRELAHEGWDGVSQDFINERVNSMPRRLQDCIDMEGRLTGY